MASNQVGFSFQGDIFGGSSLVYSAAGRLLKILSDGGVDFYAVGATVQLGATIPITATQEMAVRRLLTSRKGKVGYIAKALQLGWGYSDVAIELSRTRAGTAALMLIGALTSGGTQFDAAQALQNLLILNGCDPGMLPNVDVLLIMIRYLAPFVQDSGFRSIFQQITSTVTKLDRAFQRDASASGEPAEWSKALKQLAFTASRSENVYLIAGQRGCWLAACAVYLFGMAVEIRRGLETYWAAAGSQGSVIVQLSKVGIEEAGLDVHLCQIEGPKSRSGGFTLSLDYPLEEALQIVLRAEDRVNEDVVEIVFAAVCQRVSKLDGRLRRSIYTLLSPLPVDSGILEAVARDIGIPARSWEYGQIIESLGSVKQIRSRCGMHSSLETTSSQSIGSCLCDDLEVVVHNFACTILALAHCCYEPSTLRVQAAVISGAREMAWTTMLREWSPDVKSAVMRPDPTNNDLMKFLGQLFFDKEDECEVPASFGSSSIETHCLAISAGNTSIYHKVLFDKNGFSEYRQLIQIANGRISMNGVLRPMVETQEGLDVLRPQLKQIFYPGRGWAPIYVTLPGSTPQGCAWRIAPGLEITPSYAEGSVKIEIEADLLATAIRVSFLVRSISRSGSEKPIWYTECIKALYRCHVRGNRCGHDCDRPFEPDPSSNYSMATFGSEPRDKDDPSLLSIYALGGHGLEALVQARFLDSDATYLTLGSCLSCTVRMASDRVKAKANVGRINSFEPNVSIIIT